MIWSDFKLRLKSKQETTLVFVLEQFKIARVVWYDVGGWFALGFATLS